MIVIVLNRIQENSEKLKKYTGVTNIMILSQVKNLRETLFVVFHK